MTQRSSRDRLARIRWTEIGCSGAVAVALALMVGLLALGGCSSGPDVAGDDDPVAATAAGELARRSTLEMNRPPAPPATPVPAPPGLDATLLQSAADADDPRAAKSLAEALAELRPPAGQASIEDPPTPDAAQRDQALRHYLRARDESLRGRHLVAVTELERARELDPGDPSILRSLAQAYGAVGNAGRAMEMYHRLLQRDAGDREARLVLAMAAVSRRDYRAALSTLDAPATFDHDPAGEVLAAYALHRALTHLGYDGAAIEAGAIAASVDFPFDDGTGYRTRVATLFRKRSDIWRAMGDAHCRLGRPEAALAAYANSAGLPMSDPGALHARVVYTNLRLGRPFTAQNELLAALRSAPVVSDRDVRLSEYLIANVPEHELLSGAVAALVRERPDEPGLIRAAAVLLPPADARALLQEFVARRPRDVEVVGQLLTWLAARDPGAATDLTAALLADQPDLAEAYVDRFVLAMETPTRAISVDVDPASADRAVLRARVQLRLSALGHAWTTCERGLAQWPDHVGLRLLAIEVAAALDEPTLLARANERATDLEDARAWIVRTDAFRTVRRPEEAIAAGRAAIDAADQEGRLAVDARVALARVYLAQGGTAERETTRRAAFERASEFASEAQRLEPDREAPYRLLVTIYAPNGPRGERGRFQEVLGQLRRAENGQRFYTQLAIKDDLERRRYESALERALSLCDGDPTDAESLGLAVAAWQGLDRVDDAVRWLTARADDLPALDQLVRVLLTHDRADEAREILESRRAAGADDPALRRLLETVYQFTDEQDKALALAEERLLARPEGTRRALQLALAFARADRFEPAIENLRWLADHADMASPDHLRGAIGLANQLEGPVRDRADVTARLVERTVARFPDMQLPVYAVGLVALASLETEDARFDRLAADAAEHARVADRAALRSGILPWRDLAQTLVDRGFTDAAARSLRIRLRQSFEMGPALTPEALSVLVSMILIAEAGAEEVEPTVALLADLEAKGRAPALPGVDGIPTLASTLSATSQLLTLLGNRTGSARLLRVSLEHAIDPMVMNNLGYAAIEDGRADVETIRLIEQAIALAPDEANVIDTIAWLRYKQGRFEDAETGAGAITLLERVIGLEAQPNAEVLDHYGDTLWRMGRTDEALSTWREVVRMLGSPTHRQELVQSYLTWQSQGWGLLVADPEALYDRDFGSVLERAKEKIEQAERGGDPPVAAIFAELEGAGESF